MRRTPCFARFPIWLLQLLLSSVLALSFSLSAAAPKPKYDYYLTGNDADVESSQPPRSPSTVLMGGGPDVDDAFRWMIAKAGGGDFVVIRASGADGYNQYIYDMGGVDSVETLVIPSREAAADPFVLDRVSRAEALFIAGGDQSNYINYWKGTPLQTVIEELIARNVPIGGTSAGLAVLGEFDFAALNGTVTSAQALSDPYDRRMTRDRMGRLLTFVARIVRDGCDGWESVGSARGIGLDVETALVIDDGFAKRLGIGSAYFLSPTIAPTVCESKQPLTFRNVMVERLSGSGRFDLRHWSSPGNATTQYDISAEAGVLISSQRGGSVY
jgi:cyanophycinase